MTVRALVALTRPRLTPFVLALPGLGYGLAHWDRALPLTAPTAMARLVGAWWLLHAGTMWLNAAFDRDEGQVLLGEAVAPPPGTTRAGLVALLAAAVAAPAGLPAAALGACAFLAVGYSLPAVGWKARPWAGPIVNALGYGVLSPFAGYALVGRPPGWRAAWVFAGVTCGVLGAYYAAQVFQEREDRDRGYRTLVARRGPVATIDAARRWLAAAHAILGALALVGFLPRLLLLSVLGAAWVDRWCRAWAAAPDPGEVGGALELARRLGQAIAFDLILLSAAYVADSYARGPVAGLATVSGHP